MAQQPTREQRRIFLKQLGICFAGSAFTSLDSLSLLAETAAGKDLPRATPEAEGISSADILRFVETAEKSNAGLHSFMIVRHGSVVSEGWWSPYKAAIPHGLYSLSKNFTATAVGFAIQEKRLNLSDKVLSFFPEDKPAVVDANLAALSVRDLLTMSSGHETDTLMPLMTARNATWTKTFLSIPLKYTPGTRFVYNSGCTYMLSAIVQKVSGQKIVDYLQPRLFKPLGISGAAWDSSPQGINFGAAGLRLKTEDLAKFSQLYLQKGIWKNKRILSQSWIDEATKFQIRNDETGTPTKKEEDDIKQGYGYHFWLSRPQAEGAYRSEGAFCQFSIVMPKQDAVVAITAEGISTKRVGDLVWDILLPAMKQQALPADEMNRKALTAKLSSLQLNPPKQKPDSPLMSSVSNRQYAMEKNASGVRSLSFDFQETKTIFTLKGEKGEHTIACGNGEWITGKTSIPGSPINLLSGVPLFQSIWQVAASGTWLNENTYQMTWRFFETPHYDILTCKFTGNHLQVEYGNSITRILKTYVDPRGKLAGDAS